MPQYRKTTKRGIKWYYKFSIQGTIYQSNTIFTSQEEAEQAEKRVFKSIEALNQMDNVENTLLLRNLINKRLDYIKSNMSNKYYLESKKYLDILLDYFGNVNILVFTRWDIQKLLFEESEKLKIKNRNNHTLNTMLKTYRALFNYGIKHHDIGIKNPCRDIEVFTIYGKLETRESDFKMINSGSKS